MARSTTGTVPVAASLALRAARDEQQPLVATKATPAGAFHAARRMFLEGRRLDMQALTAELGISRATLYRWTGDRDQLLGDVIASLNEELFQRAVAAHLGHDGAARIRGVLLDYLTALAAAPPLHVFLQQETHAALRILTSRGGRVHHEMVRAIADLLREESEAGALTPHADIATLAFAIVRLGEGFIYNDAIVAIEPQLEDFDRVVALLLE